MVTFKRIDKVKELYSKIGNKRIKVVAGVRRCGKTFLLTNLFYNYLIQKKKYEESSISIILITGRDSDCRNEKAFRERLSNLALENKKIIIIDEVQEVERYQLALKDFSANYPNIDIYITGSNSNTLSSDIIANFKEISDIIYVSPLTYKEIKREKRNYSLLDYLRYGGLPDVVNSPVKKREDELKNIYRTVYEADVKDRAKKETFNYLSEPDQKIIIDNITSGSTAFSTKEVSDRLCKGYSLDQSSKVLFRKEIQNFLEILEKSFLFDSIENLPLNKNTPLEKIGLNKKYYCCDCGIAYYLCKEPIHKLTLSLETAIYLHLKRNDIKPVCKLLLNENNQAEGEIDFCFDDTDLQVTYSLHDWDYERETKSLLAIPNSNHKLLIYANKTTTQSNDVITFIDASDYLTKN